MKTIKYLFGRITDRNRSFLLKLKESGTQVSSAQLKQFLMKSIEARNWYICTKVSKYTKLFRLYRPFWIEIVGAIQRQINAKKDASTKELYYLLKFLHYIHYQPDPERDANFINKVAKVLSSPKSILLLSYITLPKQFLPSNFRELENQILVLFERGSEFTKRFLRYIIKNGIYMEYWSPDFLKTLRQSFHSHLSHYENQLMQLHNVSAVKGSLIPKENRSKIQLIFQQYLLHFGYSFESNVKMGEIFEIDFLIGDKIIVELNGNHHYCVNNYSKLWNRDRLKNWILERSGYIIINIDINDWGMIVRANNRTALERKFVFTCTEIETKYVDYLEKLN